MKPQNPYWLQVDAEVLSIMPEIPESNGKVRFSFLWPEYPGPPLEVDPNIPTEICLSILTNRFIAPLPFTYVGNSEKDNTMRAILFGYPD